MLRKMLRIKLHRAAVTGCHPDYIGSLTVDEDLLRASCLRPNEAVSIYDIDNGDRFETYVIRGAAGSGKMDLNGAAAKRVAPGHRIIVACYGHMTEEEATRHEALVLVLDAQNRVTQTLRYDSRLEERSAAV